MDKFPGDATGREHISYDYEGSYSHMVTRHFAAYTGWMRVVIFIRLYLNGVIVNFNN